MLRYTTEGRRPFSGKDFRIGHLESSSLSNEVRLRTKDRDSSLGNSWISSLTREVGSYWKDSSSSHPLTMKSSRTEVRLWNPKSKNNLQMFGPSICSSVILGGKPTSSGMDAMRGQARISKC